MMEYQAQQKQLKEIQKQQQESEQKVLMLEIKTRVSDLTTSIGLQKENFYENPEGYEQLMNEGEESLSASIEKSNLPEEKKAEARLLIREKMNGLRNTFHTGYVTDKKRQLKERLEDNVGKKQELLLFNSSKGDFSGAKVEMKDMVEALHLREQYDDEWTRQDTNNYLIELTGKMMIANVIGTTEKIKSKFDLGTINGIDNAIKYLTAYEKTLEGEGYVNATNEIFGYYATNGETAKNKVKAEIKSLMAKEKSLLSNMKKNVHTEDTLAMYRMKNDTAKYYEEETSMPVNGYSLANGGASFYYMAYTGKAGVSDKKALEEAKEKDWRWSLYKIEDKQQLKNAYKDGKIDMEYILSEREKKIGNYGLDEFWEDQFWKDIEEITGGEIDKQTAIAYKKQDPDVLNMLEMNKVFKNQPKVVQMPLDSEELYGKNIFQKIFGAKPKSERIETDEYGVIKQIPVGASKDDVTEYIGGVTIATAKLDGELNGDTYQKFMKTLDRTVNSWVYAGMTPEELVKTQNMDTEELREMAMEKLGSKEGEEFTKKAMDTTSKIYFEGRELVFLDNGDVALVPEGQKATVYEFEEFYPEATYYDPDTGKKVDRYYNDKLNIGTSQNIDDGIVIRYKNKPLLVKVKGKLVPATYDNVRKSMDKK